MSASEPTLLDVLSRHPLMLDAAVVTRAAEDGRTFRVAYVVPDPEATPERVRKIAGALAAVARSPEPVLVATVTAIPRDEHGAPDEAGLSELAVPGSVTPRPVALPAPEPGRRHLGDVVDLPRPWAAGPLPGLSGTQSDVDSDGPSSRCAGGGLDIRDGDPATLVDALLAAAESYPDKGVHVVQDGGTVLLRYPELLHAARRTLTGLRAAGLEPGDAAVLHTPSLAEHIVGLWACLLGGFRPIAVAQSATYDTRTAVLDKLEHAWLDLARPTVLSGGATVGALRDYARREGLDGLRVVDLADCAEDAAAEPHRPAPGDVAMLQLSSGSTGRPKVIQVTHHGLVRYAQGARQVSRMSTGDVFVNWLPLDHVGGVVMFHFGPVVLGCDNVHVPPERVLADPLLWLDLLDRFQAQHSWSPNFGYGLVADALAARPDRDWDLRGLKVLMNAGEQCTEPVTRRFLDAVRRFGVEDHTILLAWGMAETCTAVTYEPFGPAAVQHVRQAAPGRPLELLDAPAPGATTFLSMGAPAPGAEFRIAGADGRTELPELHIGRLQGRSPRITPGYLNNPDANAEAFPDGEWFDTGDLAFVAGGRVTITGRAKEIIIINGVHYYCHEIEDVVGALDGVAQSFAGAFGIPGADGVERLAVVFVPEPGPDGLAPVVDRIRRRLSERYGLVSAVLVAVDRDSFDKTTSGKIQRTAMRGRLLRGELDRHLRAVELAEAGPHTMPDTLHRPDWTARALPAGRTPERVVLLTGDAALRQALPGAVVAGPDEDWRDAVAGAEVLVVAPGASASTVDHALTACADEMLALTAFLAAEGWTGELVTVSRGRYVITGAEPPGYPAALTEAIGESFALEHPGVRAWHLDLPGDDRDPAVLAEALTWTHREPVLAWRDVPMARTLHPVEPRPGGTSALAPGSCWLVTGGLGGVGRAVLPGTGLRLLVVGRRPAAGLDELGEDVRYAQLDVADGAALEAAVTQAEREWGAGLSGVLHLAGTYEHAGLAETAAGRWRDQVRAKVEGSLAVAEVLARRPGSALVAFSSLLSAFPVVGASAYVAGNRFLEALCESLARDTPVHCLSWGLWRRLGLNAGHEYSESVQRGRMVAFSPAEGRALLTAALHQPPGALLLGVHPAGPRARRMLPARALEGATTPVRDVFGVDVPVAPPNQEDPPAAVEVSAVEPAADLVGVARVVRDTLRQIVPGGIPADTPFYEAGIGSLQLVRLHRLLQDALGREFPVTTLFAHGTENALARHLAAGAGGARRTAGRTAEQDKRIAIIGMAARFPDADTVDDYWRNLMAGTVSTRRSSRADLIAEGLPESLVDDPDFVPVTGALDDIAGFDAGLFGISPGEAALTDPQQRLFLQICHEALEHGGYAGTGSRVGVYAGSGMNLYSLRTYVRECLAGTDAGEQLEALQVAIGNEPDFLATRVAYRLGLTGPAVAVRSACSTSLVAVHTAVTALLAGDAELALAGAAALHVPRLAGYRYQEGSILSRRGECRPFDADADGTVGGNGVAAVLLKPLAAALADGDTVHGVILGSAVNNDGAAKVGFTSPSVAGQTAVIRDALAAADVAPETIGYVEAHGTGTALGDPIEIEALREVFGERTDPVLVGSVKANVGHLDSAAGMAGLIKTVLALRHGTVPPQANLRTPSAALRLDAGPVELPRAAVPWPVAGIRRAGVTALGVGGTNAHVVLEQPPETQAPPVKPVPWVVPLSARTAPALAELADRTATVVAADALSPADVTTTLGAGRRRLAHRLVAWGDDAAGVAGALRDGGSAAGIAADPGPVVFAFAGQGVDCAGAARSLMAYPAAAEVLRHCAAQHERTWGGDLLAPLLEDAHDWTTATLQPALLALQLAQVALLERLGVRPDVVIGHSAGEYTALCVAGALSVDDAMYLAGVRGALLQEIADGALLAVFGDAEPDGLEPAVRNGPGHVVFGGPPPAVEAAAAALSARGTDCRRVAGDRAFHTSMVEPVLAELARQAAGLDWRPLRLPVVTGLGGATLAPGTVPGADHVRTHTRETADYHAGVERLVADGATTFVELGPSGVLTALGRQWPATTWVPLRRRGSDSVMPGVAALFCHGVDVDWAALHPGRRVPLPTYPFQLTRHWAGPAVPETEGAVTMPETTGRYDEVLDRVRDLTAHHLGDKPDHIGADVPFFDLGADSLLMINMVRELEVAFGVRVAMRELFEEADTPARLSSVIVDRMPAEEPTAVVPTPEPTVAAPVSVPVAVPVSGSLDGTAVAGPVAEPSLPQLPAFPAVPSDPHVPAASGHDAVVREQLDLMGRFTQLMSEQVALLAGRPATPAAPEAPSRNGQAPAPTPPPATAGPSAGAPVQTGPRVEVDRAAGMSGGRLDERQRAHLDDLVRRYAERTARSKEIAQRYRRPLADSRAVVGFRSVTKELLYPLAAKRARGAHLEDVDGNTYVDITMGFGILMFGHEPHFVTDAVDAYLADGMRLGPRGEETGQAAALLCELTGHDRAAFASSGTEANSAAFRLARAYTGRTKIVMFDGAYHGHIDPVLGRTVPTGDGLRTVPVSPGIPDSAVAEMLVLRYGDEQSLDMIRRQAGEIAAVVVEAVPSRYPDRQPVEFVRALRELCDQYGIVLLFDEMLTGFRPHPQGAQGIFGVRADLATYGKLIGGGYPIGAIAGRADIMDWVDGGFWSYGDDSIPAGDTTFFGGTYIQHPVSMVAARAVLTWLRDQGPGLQQRLNERTARLAGTLNEFFTTEEFPVELHHFGSLFRFAHRGNLELLFHHLVLEGVHVWEWRNFFLSTAHSDGDVDFVADAVRNSLYDLRRGGFLPGSRPPGTAPRAPLPRVPAMARTPLAEPDAVEVAPTTPDFSLYFFGDYPHDRDGDKYAAILAAARYADRSGMHAVWLPERHFDSFGGVFPNPSVLAAAIAAQTSRVRIHSGSVVLPLHDPIRVAEEWSVVDNLSGGRVSLGVASGWHARDFVLAPEVYGKHREAMYSGVETIRALWRGDALTRTAGNGEPVEVRLYPRPVQEQPDFYTAIVGNPDSYRQAAANGFGVITNLLAQDVGQLAENIALYRRTRAEHGLDPAGGRVVLLLHTYLGEDTERVRAEAFEPFCDYLRSSLALFGQVTNSLGFSIDLENTAKEDLDYLLSRAYERYCADRALIGSPADCEPIVHALTAIGVDEISCFVDFGLPPARITAGLPHISALRSAFTASDVHDTTTTERQIWYLEQAFPGRPTYNESLVVRLDGDLDVEALRAAMTTVVARHPGLRSVFREIDGEPRRVVARTREITLPVTDDLGADPDEAAAAIMAAETAHPFDLAHGPLFEPRLVRLGERRHLLVLRLHHLVIDTWSADILTTELAECYRAAMTGGVPDLPEPGALAPASPVPAGSLAYWTDLLTGAPAEISLPADRPRPAEPSGRGATVSVTLDTATTAAIKELARARRSTPFMVLFAGYVAALRALSGHADVVVGTPFAHRPDGTERTVGFFVHTLPLRVRVPDDATFADLVREVRDQIISAQEHREVPLSEIVRALGGPADPLRNPLFDVAVEFDNEATFELDLPGVEAVLSDAAADRAPLDLTLFLTNLGDTIRCRLNYAVDLFDATTATRALETFRAVLTAAAAAPDGPLGDLLASAVAGHGDLARWQDGGPAAAAPRLLHDGLSEVDGPAVVDESGTLSRAELHRKADAVAAAVASLVPDADTAAGFPAPVAVHLPRSADAVVAMVGALRAGIPFVPVDPVQPPARIAAMLDQAGVTAVLSHSTIAGALPAGLPVVLVDELDGEHAPGSVPVRSPEDVVYVLFTSGSTGVPKGCVVEHRAITNTLAWLSRDLEITAADRLMWFSSPGFDASVIDVWPALHAGAPLHVVPPELRFDPPRLRDWMIGVGVTVAFIPTAMCELLLDLDWPADGSVALRHLITGGDRLRRRPSASTPFTLWNIYGPTEAAVASTWTRVPPRGEGPPTIGRPVPGTWVRVLDASGAPVPVGVAGELYLGGAQLARGYLDPAETAARFADHGEDGRLYRTGDVVRWRFDGELEFLHRNDAQVQIRGYRVEPGEVEHQLRGLTGVRDAAVRTWAGPDDVVSLAAYVVPADSAVTVSGLRAELGTRLPDYMVPTAWVALPELPLNTSGKLDRAALPEPAADRVVAEPATGLEQRLRELWCAELGVDEVSATTTFFELGGHSLTAIRLVNRIRSELGVELGVLDFLRAPTVRGLMAHLAPAGNPGGDTGEDSVVRAAPASHGQRHTYRLTRNSDTPSVLTIATRFTLRGHLDHDALRDALTALAERHPTLRTRYRRDGDDLWQEVLAPRPVPLPVVEVTEADLDAAVLDQATRPFDLDGEAGLRAVLFTVSAEVAELLVAVHHSLSDGWSTTVLIRDLGELYRAALTGGEAELPALTGDYLDFTHWEQEYLADPATRERVAAWAAQAREWGAEPLRLPVDRPRAERLTGGGEVIRVDLSPSLMERVAAVAAERGTTPFAVLLAVFAGLGHELTGSAVVSSLCQMANRGEARFEDVVGLFTHTAWLMVRVADADSFDELVTRATEAIWQRMELQAIPQATQHEELGGPFWPAPPRVLFGLFNWSMPALELEGVESAVPVDVDLPVARAEQTWNLIATDDGGMMLQVEYATQLFDVATMASWTQRYVDLLTSSLAAPDTRTWR